MDISDEDAPDACTGGSVTVTFTVTDDCGQTESCTATFSVAPAPAVTITCPQDETIAACTSQSDIDAAFAAWKDEVVFGGGCNAVLDISDEDAPDACTGGSVTVTFTVTDDCGQTESCTATFSVAPAPAVTITCPQDETIAACTSQSDIGCKGCIYI